MTLLFTLINFFFWGLAVVIARRALMFDPVNRSEVPFNNDNVSPDKYGQLALAMLQQSEHIDRFYSPVYRTSLEQTEANIRWRNHRQRILNAARETGIIPKREPSYLKGLNINWKGKKAFYTDEMFEHKRVERHEK